VHDFCPESFRVYCEIRAPSGMTSLTVGSLSIMMFERFSVTYFILSGLCVCQFVNCSLSPVSKLI